MAMFWAGIDWSEHHNDLAVVDATGAVVAHTRVPATPAGVKEVLRVLSGLRSSHRHSRKKVPLPDYGGRCSPAPEGGCDSLSET
jgi:hypothetical protein